MITDVRTEVQRILDLAARASEAAIDAQYPATGVTSAQVVRAVSTVRYALATLVGWLHAQEILNRPVALATPETELQATLARVVERVRKDEPRASVCAIIEGWDHGHMGGQEPLCYKMHIVSACLPELDENGLICIAGRGDSFGAAEVALMAQWQEEHGTYLAAQAEAKAAADAVVGCGSRTHPLDERDQT